MVSSIEKLLNISIRLINGTLTGTITPDQSGPNSNGNKQVVHIPQNWYLTLRCRTTFLLREDIILLQELQSVYSKSYW